MIPPRLARELTYQLDRAGEQERLARALAGIPMFLTLFQLEDASELLLHWHRLTLEGRSAEVYYSISLRMLRERKSSFLPDTLANLYILYETRGSYNLAIDLMTELLVWSEDHGDTEHVMAAENGLGLINYRRGNYDKSMYHLQRAHEIAIRLDDKNRISHISGNMGIVHFDRGDHDDAMACFDLQLELARLSGDKHMQSVAIGNIGNIHAELSRFDEAMASYELHYQMAEALGDVSGMARAIGNIGTLDDSLGRYKEALYCNQRLREMSESIGDKNGVIRSICNIGQTLCILGYYDQAFDNFEQFLDLARSIGDRKAQYVGIGNIGCAQMELGRYDDATNSLLDALAGHREMHFQSGVIAWLLALGNTMIGRGDTISARGYIEECLAISLRLSNDSLLFAPTVLIARIDAAEGNTTLATEKLEAMLTEVTDEEQIADLHYWLWKIARRDPNKREALTRHTELYDRVPRFEFRKRIAELKGERIPMSADDLQEAA